MPRESLDLLASRYLAFLSAALVRETGRFRNFMSHERHWLEEAGSEDSHGRALWALGSGASRSQNEGHRRLCTQLFERGLDAVGRFTSPRAWAFALLGLHEFQQAHPGHPDVLGCRRTAGRETARLLATTAPTTTGRGSKTASPTTTPASARR